MNRYTELYQLLISLQSDFDKFYDHKNKAAGTRVRIGLQEVKKLSQEIRQEIIEIKRGG